MTDPEGNGVVVVVFPLGVVAGTAVEGVDDVIGREGRVRREDANLEIAELVGLHLAVFQPDQQSIRCFDVVVDCDEVLSEKAADRGEVTFGHPGPEMLLEVDDLDGSRRLRCGLSRRERGKAEGGRKEEETHEPC